MTTPLIACHECDLLQRELHVPLGGVVRCSRCGAELYRSHPQSFERTLALAVGAVLLFILANAFPIVGLKLQGQVINTTLWNTVQTLWNEDVRSVSALVFVTTILMPALELAALMYLLVPLQFGRAPAHFAIVFRVMQKVRPWGMVEVLMLGIIVSLVKLAHLAGIVPGVALGAFAVLMFVMAAIAAVLDAHDLWARFDAASRRSAAAGYARSTSAGAAS